MKDLYERLITDYSESTKATNDTTPCEETITAIIADDTIAYQNARVKETKKSVLEVMQCMMCPADREGNRCGGYTIFAYNNAVAFNGDNVYSNELGALAYQCKNYGNANVYKLDVETIGWKNRKEK